MKLKALKRGVRRVRHLSAWVNVNGVACCECQIMDISTQGAKIVVAMTSTVPDIFELAFIPGGAKRMCNVVWRRANVIGIKFA